MKATELMIGDFIECVDSTHENKVYAQVCAIEEGQTCILVEKDCSNWFLDISFIKPILLTSEILIKIGFEHKHQNEPDKRQYWLLKHDGAEVKAKVNRGKFYFEITGIPKAFGLFCPSFSAHLDYLNELQHALRLCRIEKDIIIRMED